MEFLTYALQGFVDSLESQIETIQKQILNSVWINYVHEMFTERNGVADTRRRHLVLDLSNFDSPIPRRNIRTLTPRLAEAYLNRTNKTITRDLNALREMRLITQTHAGIVANSAMMRAFLPPAVDSSTERAPEPQG